MSSGKRVLGRGLADLIPVGGGEGASSGSASYKDTAIGVAPDAAAGPPPEAPIASVHANPQQPRSHFDEDSLQELAASIRANGILQPILVRPRTAGGYEIVAGERRYRAALLAGLTAVPIIVRELTDAETLAVALIENLIREDIGPLETARAFRRLMDDFGWTQEEMGRRVGKSRPAVANSLRLLELPAPIQQCLEAGEISEGHARALLGDRSERDSPRFQEKQQRVFRQVASRGLSVRDAERLMRDDGAAPAAGAPPTQPKSGPAAGDGAAGRTMHAAGQDPNRRALEDRLRDVLGTQVRIVGADERGRVEIEYFSADELDGLVARLEATFSLRPERIGPQPGNGSRG